MDGERNIADAIPEKVTMQSKVHYPQVRPAADLFEEGANVKIVVNMPGVDRTGLDISALGTVIRVRASSRCPVPTGQDRELRNLEFGSVEYALDIALERPLSAPFDVELENGVLTLILPTCGKRPAVVLR